MKNFMSRIAAIVEDKFLVISSSDADNITGYHSNIIQIILTLF
ncbi:5998_t:CDS:2 [Cetraspora pellucida]|uniref:5998_t:CDS:1 n=1 Tax=Cetraspora pellucida TaxID=1433469 RepID=A0ACA9KW15_9GLOM|nr:5998_t:CDS:2 [Cetraspora pellucida]